MLQKVCNYMLSMIKLSRYNFASEGLCLKKILYFSHGLSANGIEVFLVNVLKRLDLKKYDVTVLIAIDEGIPSLYEEDIRSLGIKIINAGDLDSLKKKYEYIKNVKNELKTGNYDIVHSNMDLLNGITLFLAKRAGIKKRICHAHNSKSQYQSVGRLAFVKKTVHKFYVSVMKNSILKSSTHLLSCSELAGEYFYGNKKTQVIYNGIDLNEFKTEDGFNKDEYTKALNLPVGTQKIISVGRLSMQKNPIFALEVIAELKKICSNFTYVWVGSGELESQAKAKAKELMIDDITVFTGVRSDVSKVLKCCDLFFLPSLFEGLGIVYIEAQFSGLKCVASTEVPSLADIGRVKYFSLEKSAEEWAQFLNRELDAPTPSIDPERAKNFDINYTVKQLEEIYDN